MSQSTKAPRAALLARCSSEANVCDQILNLRKVAAGTYQVDEDDIYGDNIGGGSPLAERKELCRLMENIEKGSKKYEVVLVQDPSRIGRTKEQVQELVEWFAKRNASLQFLHP
jgi:DNA invertase Pin-like site-specific DNA recombinase